MIVTRKLTAPSIDDAERMWSPRIQRSMPLGLDGSICRESGTYPVQPAFALERRRRMPAGGSIQNAMALIRGSAISFAPIIEGTRRFPNPARTGITNMKIINTPCIVNSVE